MYVQMYPKEDMTYPPEDMMTEHSITPPPQFMNINLRRLPQLCESVASPEQVS